MKKLTSIIAFLLLGAATLSAQNAFVGGKTAWTIALQGGPMYSINENGFSYRDHGKGINLFTFQGSAAVGYEFTSALGVRLSVGYGKNPAAANSLNSGGGFYPYSFRSVNAFVDGTLDLNGNYGIQQTFRPRFYLGVGLGHTFHFTDSGHPWQEAYITKKNTVFGFRGGFIGEFDLTDSFGLFGDLGLEAYNDKYNGLEPTKQDQSYFKGYGGFPLDLRFTLSFGIIFRFND